MIGVVCFMWCFWGDCVWIVVWFVLFLLWWFVFWVLLMVRRLFFLEVLLIWRIGLLLVCRCSFLSCSWFISGVFFFGVVRRCNWLLLFVLSKMVILCLLCLRWVFGLFLLRFKVLLSSWLCWFCLFLLVSVLFLYGYRRWWLLWFGFWIWRVYWLLVYCWEGVYEGWWIGVWLIMVVELFWFGLMRMVR